MDFADAGAFTYSTSHPVSADRRRRHCGTPVATGQAFRVSIGPDSSPPRFPENLNSLRQPSGHCFGLQSRPTKHLHYCQENIDATSRTPLRQRAPARSTIHTSQDGGSREQDFQTRFGSPQFRPKVRTPSQWAAGYSPYPIIQLQTQSRIQDYRSPIQSSGVRNQNLHDENPKHRTTYNQPPILSGFPGDCVREDAEGSSSRIRIHI